MGQLLVEEALALKDMKKTEKNAIGIATRGISTHEERF